MKAKIINDVEDKLELAKIGGTQIYKDYCLKMKKFVDDFKKENPNIDLNQFDIAKGAHVPVIAVERAIREEVFEDKKEIEAHKKKPATSQERRAELIRELSAVAKNNIKKEDRSKLVSDLEKRKKENTKNQDSWKNYR